MTPPEPWPHENQQGPGQAYITLTQAQFADVIRQLRAFLAEAEALYMATFEEVCPC